MELAVGALIACLAFDAGVYAASYRGKLGNVERTVEPIALLATAVGLAIASALPGRAAGAAVLIALASRSVFDAFHLGDGYVLALPLPRDYALYGMLTKISAAAVFILFAFPA